MMIAMVIWRHLKPQYILIAKEQSGYKGIFRIYFLSSSYPKYVICLNLYPLPIKTPMLWYENIDCLCFPNKSTFKLFLKPNEKFYNLDFVDIHNGNQTQTYWSVSKSQTQKLSKAYETCERLPGKRVRVVWKGKHLLSR